MLYFDEGNTNEPDVKRFKRDDGVINRNLNFAISADAYLNMNEERPMKNQVSHRVTEKRRRDRMNNYLVDLSKLIPNDYLKQGQRRTEKTEIIEMAIKLIKNLQAVKNEPSQSQDPLCLSPLGENAKPCCISKFYMGFKECQDEVMRFLVETEGINTSDRVCVCMMDYLGQAAKKFLPTTGRGTAELDSSKMPCFPVGLTSNRFSQSVSPAFQDGASSSENSDPKKMSINSDSGFTNMDSAFSSLSLPLGSSQTNDRNASLDHSANYEAGKGFGQSSYKFKHIITKRFSLEQVKQQQSESSFSCSHEEQSQEAASRSILKSMLSNYNRGSNTYPSSSDDGYSQSPLHSSVNSAGGQANQAREGNINLYLPGFVLHPSGTHYFPISIHPSNVPQSFVKIEGNAGVVFHPVSIPVRLTGPHIEIAADCQTPA